MKGRIAVIDYGMGNLRSVAKALELAGGRVTVTDKPKEIAAARACVFPGVGSFGPAVRFLRKSGIGDAIRETVAKEKPFLGICLGFQLLLSASEEEGNFKGLDVIPGAVVRFDFRKKNRSLKVPHMGWNRVRIARPELKASIFRGIPDSSYFYFVHSYYAKPQGKAAVAGTTDYGFDFCSAAATGRTWACQFHPEKSGVRGLTLLENFVREVKQC